MRLLNARTQQLELFNGNAIPKYAILSHTWGEGEVLFEDLVPIKASATKKGWKKIDAACAQTVREEFEYIWIDTCCIDKSSSSELSEAINSMFQYYRNATICYAHLEDVEVNSDVLCGNLSRLRPLLSPARWFKRGWTLQELIASNEIKFYSSIWKYIGSKMTLGLLISNITGIDKDVLINPQFLATVSIAKRFSWVANRETSRPEDIAYCLMGIFNVNMPLLYGEGKKAFIRLQEEIMKDSEDESIFAWEWDHEGESIFARESDDEDGVGSVAPVGILALSPKNFARSRRIQAYESNLEPYAITNRGLRIQIPILKGEGFYQHICVIHCRYDNNLEESIGVPLRTKKESPGRYFRDVTRPLITLSVEQRKHAEIRTVFIHKAGWMISRSQPTPLCHLRKFPKGVGIDLVEAIAVTAQDSGLRQPKPGYGYTRWNLEERTMIVDPHLIGYFGALKFSVKSMLPDTSEIQETSFVTILELPRSGRGSVGLVPLMETDPNKLLTLTEVLHCHYWMAKEETADMDFHNGSIRATIQPEILFGKEVYFLDVECQLKEGSERTGVSTYGNLLIPEIHVEEVL